MPDAEHETSFDEYERKRWPVSRTLIGCADHQAFLGMRAQRSCFSPIHSFAARLICKFSQVMQTFVRKVHVLELPGIFALFHTLLLAY